MNCINCTTELHGIYCFSGDDTGPYCKNCISYVKKSSKIFNLIEENNKLKTALKNIGGCCTCPSTEEYPYGRAMAPIEIHESNCDYGIKRDALK